MSRWRRPGAVVAIAAVVLGVQRLIWPAPVGVLVQGALLGGLTALIALGLALVYRAQGAINFAQGDLGAFPASLAVLLIVSTKLSYWLALGTGLATAAALGVVIEIAVARRLARSSRLVLTVGTIGLAQVLAAGGLLIPRAFSLRVPPQRYPPPLNLTVSLGGVRFTGNDIVVMIVVPLVLASLWLFFDHTSTGTAIRAAADNPLRARTLGINVDGLNMLVWVMASALATLAVFLRAGVVGLPIGTVLGPGVLLRALAAVALGGMDDLPTIAVAGMGLGVIEQAIVFHTGDTSLVDSVLFVVILVAFGFARWSRRRTRLLSETAGLAPRELRLTQPRPRQSGHSRTGRIIGASALVAALAILPILVPTSRLDLITTGIIYALVALSLYVLTGWTGHVSLGQMALAGIGGAVAGRLVLSSGIDPILTLVIAGLVGAAAAGALGVPALRAGGLEVAVATLAFALATSSYFLDPAHFGWLPAGTIGRQRLLGVLSLSSEGHFYGFTLAVLLLSLAGIRGLRRSRTGRALIAVRDNPAAAASAGLNATRVTLAGFAFSGFLAATAGALLVLHQQALGASPYLPAESLVAFTMVVVGGLGPPAGALLGAAYVRGATWLLSGDWRLLATGAGVLGVLLITPDGLAGLAWRAAELGTRRARVPRERQTQPRAGGLPPDPPVVLAGQGLVAGYGTTTVLRGIDIEARAGEIVGVLGHNGAGKSTLLGVLAGTVTTDSGETWLDGRRYHLRPHRLARRGLALLPGGKAVFGSLTVAENLRVATGRRAGATDVLGVTFPELSDRLASRADELSGGQQQMLGLAMVLAREPRALLVDELSIGLSPAAIERAVALLRGPALADCATIVVEQSPRLLERLAERVLVLERGRTVYCGPPSGMPALRPVFLHEQPAPRAIHRPRHVPRAPLLSVAELTAHFGGVLALEGVSLQVGSGEVVGVIGANGAGKTTMADVISGHHRAHRGTVTLDGVDLSGMAPHARARLGLGRTFQDNRLFPALTLEEAVAVAAELHIAVRDPVAEALHLPDATDAEEAVRARVARLVEAVGLQGQAHVLIDELSTGMRQLAQLACMLAQAPRLAILDEPTAGLAEAEAVALVGRLRRLCDTDGMSLLVIEHDLGVIAALADRAVALERGRVIAEGNPAEVIAHPALVETLGG